MNNFLDSSPLLALLSVFGMGILSSLTPCVYPLIPVTVSIFGASQSQSRKKAAILSAFYVLGMALTYTTLGMISAKTGMLFGSLLGHPAVAFSIAALMLLLSMHTLDVIVLPFAKLQSKASTVGGKGLFGALVMGLVSGAVAAPCVGPVLVIVLIEAGRSSSLIWGAMLLFSYSLGLGLLFFIIGTFSGSLSRLPRAGNWLYGVKYIIAVALVGVSLFILRAVIGETLEQFSLLLPGMGWFAAGLILSLLAFVPKLEKSRFPAAVLSGFCAFAIIFAPEVSDRQSSQTSSVVWNSSISAALKEVALNKKLLMVDMFATWCASCKELDHTFSDPQVAKKLSDSFVAVRIDFTSSNDETDSLSQQYNIVGLPCVLFLDQAGNEIPESRLTGFVNPQEFLSHIEKFLPKV